MRGCALPSVARRSAPAADRSMICPLSMNTTSSATSRANRHLVRDDEHRHPLLGELAHRAQHLADQFRVQRRGYLVEEHDARDSSRARGRSRRAAAVRRTGAPGARRACPRGRRAAAGRSPASPRPPASCPRTRRGASVMFSITVRCGNRLNCWNTMPTFSRKRLERRAIGARAGIFVAFGRERSVDPDRAALNGLERGEAAQQACSSRSRSAR